MRYLKFIHIIQTVILICKIIEKFIFNGEWYIDDIFHSLIELILRVIVADVFWEVYTSYS